MVAIRMHTVVVMLTGEVYYYCYYKRTGSEYGNLNSSLCFPYRLLAVL